MGYKFFPVNGCGTPALIYTVSVSILSDCIKLHSTRHETRLLSKLCNNVKYIQS